MRERVKSTLRSRYLWLFGILFAVTAGYFAIRYLALGPEYVLSYSYDMGFNPLWVVWMNLLNNFTYIPQSYIQIHDVVLNRSIILAHLNFLVFVSLCIWAIREEDDSRLRKSLLFSLTLIVVNGVIATQLIRPRFNLVGELGSFAILTIAGRRLVAVLWRRSAGWGRLFLITVLAGLAVVYAATNITNVLNRYHSHEVFRYRDPVSGIDP